PVHTYLAENKEARKRARSLRLAALGGSLEAVANAVRGLKPIITHFERKENQLFPYLERKGFTGPSKVMWGKHDEIRAVFRELDAATGSAGSKAYRAKARDLARRIRAMIFMEEKILLPNALKRLSDAEWAEVRRGEDAIGFSWVKPGAEWDPALVAPAGGGAYARFNAAVAAASAVPGASATQNSSSAAASIGPDTPIPLSTGALPLKVLDAVLKSLPVDVSFVGADDAVMYYSDSPHRVFPRSPAIIGRAVQNCHPPKSVHIVEQIVEAFKRKEKDKADFWIQMGDRFIVISYKPIYDADGTYLGTLEMSGDATDVRALEGQRRLLDW
ncbi:MAG TPA: PAS domain-containing protein, partial [Spirochaetales bacterium]|nr:PAS domain-containing protein [Spirochaetales bacterium]